MKKLPLNPSIIEAYPSSRNLLSALNHNALPWIYNKFIQIKTIETNENSDYQPVYFPEFNFFDECPYLHLNKLTNDFVVEHWGNFSNFVTKVIDNEYYVQAHLDRSQIKYANSSLFYPHVTLFYGYCPSKRIINIADFYHHIYTEIEVSFNEIDNAYRNFYNNFEWQYDFPVRVYKTKEPEQEQLEFNLDYFLDVLTDYYNSTNNFEKYKYIPPESKTLYGIEDNVFFGIKACESSLNHIVECHSNNFFIPYEIFSLLYDRSNLMCKRLEYLFNERILTRNNDLHLLYQDICNNMKILQSLGVKINALVSYGKEPRELYKRIIDNFHSSIEKEKKAIQMLFASVGM